MLWAHIEIVTCITLSLYSFQNDSIKDPEFLKKLEEGCYQFNDSVWDRYEFQNCNKLTSWRQRTLFLVNISLYQEHKVLLLYL